METDRLVNMVINVESTLKFDAIFSEENVYFTLSDEGRYITNTFLGYFNGCTVTLSF